MSRITSHQIVSGTKRDIEARTFEFAVRIVKMAKVFPRDVVPQVVIRQLTRSGTSVGANVEEGQGSHSRAEFIRRIGIARSEASEALYWLRLCQAAELAPGAKLSAIITEANEIVSVLTAIVKNARSASRE